MASTVLVKEALWRAAVLLQDSVPQFVRWPEKELVDWLNDAQNAITKFLPAACSRVDAIKLKPGTRQSIEVIAPTDCKPGDGSTPTQPILGNNLLGVMRNMGSDGATPGVVIRLVAQDILDSQSPMWHTVIGAVVFNYTYNPNTPRYFYVSPGIVSAPAVWIEASYTAQPIKVPNTGTPGAELYLDTGTNPTTISIADEYIDDLVNYIVARANMKPTDFADANKAAYFAGLFTSSLNAKVVALTGNNPNLQRLPFAPTPVGQAA